MTAPVKLAYLLYSRLLTASKELRQELDPFLVAIRESGAIPLGCRRNGRGELEYCWLVYDPRPHASSDEIEKDLRLRSPPDIKLKILFL